MALTFSDPNRSVATADRPLPRPQTTVFITDPTEIGQRGIVAGLGEKAPLVTREELDILPVGTLVTIERVVTNEYGESYAVLEERTVVAPGQTVPTIAEVEERFIEEQRSASADFGDEDIYSNPIEAAPERADGLSPAQVEGLTNGSLVYLPDGSIIPVEDARPELYGPVTSSPIGTEPNQPGYSSDFSQPYGTQQAADPYQGAVLTDIGYWYIENPDGTYSLVGPV